MNKMIEEHGLQHCETILTPFCLECLFPSLSSVYFPIPLANNPHHQQRRQARRSWEIFASCSFFVHLHREVPNHARSEGSKCNPSKYNGANPHEQAPTDGSTYYPLDLAIRAARVFKNTSLFPNRFPYF